MKTRTCAKCGEEKAVGCFYKRKSDASGFDRKCKVCSRKYMRAYIARNRERVKQLARQWHVRNRGFQESYNQTYYQANADKLKERQRIYRLTHKREKNEWEKKYISERRKHDPGYRAVLNLRRRILAAINGENKSSSTLSLLGTDKDGVRKYLESQFEPGMSWKNYGRTGWHIDHIKPCVSFDLSDPKQQEECFHFTNLRPRWALDNISQGEKYKYGPAT